MKRILYFVVLLSLSLPQANAQSVKHLTLTYNEPDFSYSYDTDGCLAIDSEILPFVLGEDTLAPALPYFPLYVLINPELDYASTSITCQDSVVFTNVNIAPNPIPLPTNLNTTEMVWGVVSYTDSIYPDENVEYRGTQIIAGYKVLSFLVSPYKYLSQNKQLRFVKSLDVDINLVPMSPTQEMPTRIGNAMRDFVASLVVNKEEMDSLYPTSPQAHGNGLLAPPLGENAKYRYVIITDSSLVEAYRPLAEWKTIKGVRAKIITTQEICSTQSNDTPQLKIKKKLRDLYEEGLEYALLGGNVDLVPAQMCKITDSIHFSKDTLITTPTDLYYACFNNFFDWNEDGDSLYGEIEDSVDLSPFIFVSRIPLSNYQDVDMFVNRVLNYEKGISTDSVAFNNRILLCGGNLSNNNYVRLTSDNMYKKNIKPYQKYPCFRFYDTDTDYPDGASYQLTGDHLQSEIEKGYAFVDYGGHGWCHAWGELEENTLYDYHHARSLHNNSYTVVTTICCHSNAFDKTAVDGYDDNHKFSIVLLKNPNSSVIAYLGSSREGFSSTSYLYSSSFYNKLFGEKCFNFARLVQSSKSLYQTMTKTSERHRWLQYSINPLGDPEMPLRISTPKSFDSIIITLLGEESIYVNANVDSCVICVMSANDNGFSYYRVDTLRQKTYPFAADTMSICITKDNYIPVVYKYVKGGNLYIQNETMHGNNHIHGGYIMVGSNVTIEKEEGPVIIEDGATTIECTNGVTITRDFEVKEDAEFEIKISN
ncbi:MAG: hypothetical protein IJK87_08275 [Prevotella sp.]|nr:hypothetical protein [Prevotella sp.]